MCIGSEKELTEGRIKGNSYSSENHSDSTESYYYALSNMFLMPSLSSEFSQPTKLQQVESRRKEAAVHSSCSSVFDVV